MPWLTPFLPVSVRFSRLRVSVSWIDKASDRQATSASANASITFKVPEVAESGQKYHKSALSKARCSFHRSEVALSAQI